MEARQDRGPRPGRWPDQPPQRQGWRDGRRCQRRADVPPDRQQRDRARCGRAGSPTGATEGRAGGDADDRRHGGRQGPHPPGVAGDRPHQPPWPRADPGARHGTAAHWLVRARERGGRRRPRLGGAVGGGAVQCRWRDRPARARRPRGDAQGHHRPAVERASRNQIRHRGGRDGRRPRWNLRSRWRPIRPVKAAPKLSEVN